MSVTPGSEAILGSVNMTGDALAGIGSRRSTARESGQGGQSNTSARAPANDASAATGAAPAQPQRKRGPKPGTAKVPGSGRRKNSVNLTTVEARRYLVRNSQVLRMV